MTDEKPPIMAKEFRLGSADGKIQITWVHEQQVRSLKEFFARDGVQLEVIETRSYKDNGRTAQRDREDAQEAADAQARVAGQKLAREALEDED